MSSLINIQTGQSCNENWAAMPGDTRQRHCAQCAKDVLNCSSMTEREIEQLSWRVAAGEAVCARLEWNEFGTLARLKAKSSWKSKVAGAATSLMLLGSAAAQKTQPDKADHMAVLSGRFLLPNGSGAHNAVVTLIPKTGAKPVSATADANGNFSVLAPPATYDITIRQNALFAASVPNATLHEGPQSLGELHGGIGLQPTTYVTMGEMVMVQTGPRYWIRHPMPTSALPAGAYEGR